MKKNKRPTKTSKVPPKGWPSDETIKEAERKLKNTMATKTLSPRAGPVEQTKHVLCEQFIYYQIIEEITQRELAKRLEVTENRVSEILHYQHQHFTIDRLLELLSRLKPGVTLKVA